MLKKFSENFLSGLMELEKRNRSSVTVKLGKMKSSSCVLFIYLFLSSSED